MQKYWSIGSAKFARDRSRWTLLKSGMCDFFFFFSPTELLKMAFGPVWVVAGGSGLVMRDAASAMLQNSQGPDELELA